MEKKLNLSIILPIKSTLAKDFDTYFESAIKSLTIQKTTFNELIIVHTQEEQLVTKLKNYDFESLNVKLVEYIGEPSFQKQISFGVEHAESQWVSFFEFDDEYSNIWFDNVLKYSEIYPDVDAFLPIVVDVDNKGTFAGFTNEATFAANFSQEMGYLTNETLQDYQNFQTAGSVIKKQVIEDFGGFKPSVKLTFVYEFLLRLTHNGVRIMTVPKAGYQHVNLREDSLFWKYKNEEKMILSENEVKFWLDTAKKEFFFKNKRDVNYEIA